MILVNRGRLTCAAVLRLIKAKMEPQKEHRWICSIFDKRSFFFFFAFLLASYLSRFCSTLVVCAWAPLFTPLRYKTAARPFLPFAMCNKNLALPNNILLHRTENSTARQLSPEVMPAQVFGQHRDMQQKFANLISLYLYIWFYWMFRQFLPFCNSVQALPPILGHGLFWLPRRETPSRTDRKSQPLQSAFSLI
jgi:hypothetical protein